MSDEQFEEFLTREGQAYNPPPSDVPRDEMWESIRAQRASRAGVRPVVGASRFGAAMPTQKDKPTLKYASIIGMAATLLLGIGIGRYALQRDAAVSELASQIELAMTGNVQSTSPFPDSMPDGPIGAAERADASLVTLETAPTRQATLRTPTGASSRVAMRNGAAEPTANEPNAAIQIVSRNHLSRAEALVSVVAASPADAVMDSLTGRWARDMLTNTRLLLDSPAGEDPARRRLLEDLETVLVQLLQRTGGAVDERALIDRTLERTQLLSRLRSGAAGI